MLTSKLLVTTEVQTMFMANLHLKENIKKHKSEINLIDQFYNNEMVKYVHK